MPDKESNEKKQLKDLNDNLDGLIKQIKNQVINQQEYEKQSIYGLLKERMGPLWTKMEKEKDTNAELETCKIRLENEENRTKELKNEIKRLKTENISAELECKYQKKCNILLREEIEALKEIYEEKIGELHSKIPSDVTETDASAMKDVLQKMKEQEKNVLSEQKKKVVEMENLFKQMKENLAGFDEAIQNKLDLKSEIEKYRMLLSQMKARVGSEGDPSQTGLNTALPPEKKPKDNAGGKKSPPAPNT